MLERCYEEFRTGRVLFLPPVERGRDPLVLRDLQASQQETAVAGEPGEDTTLSSKTKEDPGRPSTQPVG
jgi:hypothetical protein